MKSHNIKYYILSIMLFVGAILVGITADWEPLFDNIAPYVFFTLIFTLSAFLRIDIGSNNIMALNDAIGFAALLSFGPAFASAVYLVGMIIHIVVSGDIVFQRLVLTAAGILGFFVAALIYYDGLGGLPGLAGGNHDILAAVLAALAMWMVDRVCAYTLIALTGSVRIHELFNQLKPYLLSLPPLYIWGMVGAYLFIEVGYIMTLIFLLLLIVVYVFMQSQKKYYDTVRNMVFSMAKMIDARDSYTAKHSHNVATNARRIAKKLGFSADELQAIYETGLLHDIGKVGIRDSILLKEAALDEEEWVIMRQHPVIGSNLIEDMRFKLSYNLGIRHHHERWDGRGYPDNLAGTEIPLWARIIAICDAWDSMRSERPYRKALSIDQALDQIRKGSGGQFDPNLVQIAIEVFQEVENNADVS